MFNCKLFSVVGGIPVHINHCTVQVKIKSVITLSHLKTDSEVTTELYCNLKQLFSSFLAAFRLIEVSVKRELTAIS